MESSSDLDADRPFEPCRPIGTSEIVNHHPGIPRFLYLLKLRVIGFPVPPYYGLLRTAIARRDGRDR
jgi:hypothetical protein